MWLQPGWTWLDPALSLAIAGLILWGTFGLIREITDVLMEGVPKHLELADVQAAMAAASPDITAIHDLHLWTISSGLYALSAHVVIRAEALGRNDEILTAVKPCSAIASGSTTPPSRSRPPTTPTCTPSARRITRPPGRGSRAPVVWSGVFSPVLAFRPARVVERLEPRSAACPLSSKDLIRAAAELRLTLPLVRAPTPGVARAALVAAKQLQSVLGLSLPGRVAARALVQGGGAGRRRGGGRAAHLPGRRGARGRAARRSRWRRPSRRPGRWPTPASPT